MDADLEDASTDPALRADVADLFTACLHLGRSVEEFDAATNATAPVFRRDAQWREALAAVRRLLKRYHTHGALPVRRALAQLRVLRDKLLPMLAAYHADRCVPTSRALARAGCIHRTRALTRPPIP